MLSSGNLRHEIENNRFKKKFTHFASSIFVIILLIYFCLLDLNNTSIIIPQNGGSKKVSFILTKFQRNFLMI